MIALSTSFLSLKKPGSIGGFCLMYEWRVVCFSDSGFFLYHPAEAMENTLEPADRVGRTPSYWSSRGHRDPAAMAEFLIYGLQSDLCLVDEIKVQPIKVFFRDDQPIYSAKRVRFQMGYPKSPLQSETLVYGENEGWHIADSNYIWTYRSPEFTMLQENVLQSFKLPHPVLCIGGAVKIELLGGVVKDAYDGRYYICVSHVQVMGKPLSRELRVGPRGNGVVLSYYVDPRRCGMPHSESSGDDGRSKSTALHRGRGTLL